MPLTPTEQREHDAASKRAYKKRNPEKMLRYSREYKERNRETIRLKAKEYYAANRERIIAKNLEKERAHPEVRRASRKVGRALKNGTLIRGVCKVCGSEKVQGHHEDYSKPLDVIWLCHKHHRQLHAGYSDGSEDL